ncbi:DUF4817 domain-containing protein [Trichonephila clavipes]|nr:DUF4817 domain-containing protein [Trichonephila clavipes]
MIFFQEQRIAIVVFYFATKPHCNVINVFQQKYPGETAPNASKITRLVQRLCDTGTVADRKQSVRASIVKNGRYRGRFTKKSNEKTVHLYKHHFGIHILAEQ